MTRREKLIERIRARPAQAGFDDVRRLVEAFGWELKRQRGSHVTFRRPDGKAVTIPLVGGRKVRRPYLDDLCEMLGLESS